jgi:hypothetical protein
MFTPLIAEIEKPILDYYSFATFNLPSDSGYEWLWVQRSHIAVFRVLPLSYAMSMLS